MTSICEPRRIHGWRNGSEEHRYPDSEARRFRACAATAALLGVPVGLIVGVREEVVP